MNPYQRTTWNVDVWETIRVNGSVRKTRLFVSRQYQPTAEALAEAKSFADAWNNEPTYEADLYLEERVITHDFENHHETTMFKRAYDENFIDGTFHGSDFVIPTNHLNDWVKLHNDHAEA